MFEGPRGTFGANIARQTHRTLVVLAALGLGAIVRTVSGAEKVVLSLPRPIEERNFASPFAVPRHPQQLADHVVIPHGEGLSYGISYGKAYVPDNEFGGEARGGRPGFSGGGENHLGYTDDVPFPSSIGATDESFDRPADACPPHPRRGPPESSVAPIKPEVRKMTPVVLRDTVDLGEYMARIEMLARSWPYAGGLAKFQGENRPIATWGAAGSGGGYRVREESPESETTGG
ncbi:uncharacterized protein LOC125502100 [Athalia rosae]|uniref:uncharacterized protein LOC125502100 n=1 Tax=Athalia rosae TaxID=37344 RepID=UPI0020335B95|nr:uncharacterized protein LOC125502100 [Athalia rosae]